MTVEKLRQFIQTEETDTALEARLQALELSVRAYTNNNFQQRAFRAVADAQGDTLYIDVFIPFAVGDTLQITDSDFMLDCLVTITDIDGLKITVDKPLYPEAFVTVTKVVYPADVQMGIVNLMKWEIENRDKVGIASESISRHSVTYFDMSADNSAMGYPAALMGFLKPYMRARFGKGVKI